MQRLKNERGFSLVELLVATAILSIAAAVVFGFMITSSNFFKRSKEEINVQTSAQETANWLSEHIKEAGLGLSVNTDGATGDITLEIYNTDNIYTVFYDKSEGVIYCDESRFNTTDGTVYRVTNDKENILAEYVTDFTLDVSKANTDSKLVTLSVAMEYGEKASDLNKTVTLRNNIKVNEEIENVYKDVNIIASSVTSVTVTPDEVTVAKGATQQFYARVIGIGFPSQTVVWSIVDRTGLKDETTIDSKTGLLTIAADETVTAFRVMATAVETDSEGNTVTSTQETGKVKVATITYVEIINEPSEKVDVGEIISLSALVHGENMDGNFQQVKWSIPEGFEHEGLTVASDGKVTLGFKLYDSFAIKEQRDVATVRVRATSVKDPSKYDECDIALKFSDVQINFSELSVEANRNGTLDLGDKIKVVGISSDDMYFLWSISDYGKLSGKVSIDSNLGLVSVAKDIDYTKEYSFKVHVRMIAKSTGEETDSADVTVVVPKVSVELSSDAENIVKGTSARIAYEVKGLVPGTDELRSTSTPAVRNTLLYMQNNYLNVSVGNDAKSGNFTVKLYLLNNSAINDTCTITISEEAISDDEKNATRNVEDLYMHFPVPDTDDRNAPTNAEVLAGEASVTIDNFVINYSYDSVRNRYKIQIGDTGTVYFYKKEAGSNIVWHVSNADRESKAAFYAPTPTEGAFPGSLLKGSGNKTMSIRYKNETIQYKRIDYGVSGEFAYLVYDEESNHWFQYMSATKRWVYAVNQNIAKYGSAISFDDSYVANANVENGNYAYKAIDGDLLNTRWESVWDKDPQSLEVDLGSLWHINTVSIHWENARAATYYIVYSKDYNTWYCSELYTKTAADGLDDLNIPVNADARYIKIEGWTRLNGYGYSVYEFEIYANNYTAP